MRVFSRNKAHEKRKITLPKFSACVIDNRTISSFELPEEVQSLPLCIESINNSNYSARVNREVYGETDCIIAKHNGIIYSILWVSRDIFL